MTSKNICSTGNFWWKSIYCFINPFRIWFDMNNVPSRNAEEAGGRLRVADKRHVKKTTLFLMKTTIKTKQNYIHWIPVSIIFSWCVEKKSYSNWVLPARQNTSPRMVGQVFLYCTQNTPQVNHLAVCVFSAWSLFQPNFS